MIITSQEARDMNNRSTGYIVGCNIAFACSVFTDLDGLLKEILKADFYYDKVVLYQIKTDEFNTHLIFCKLLKEKFVLCGELALPSAHDKKYGTILLAIDIKKTREKYGVSMNRTDDDDEDEEDEEQEINLDEDDQ